MFAAPDTKYSETFSHVNNCNMRSTIVFARVGTALFIRRLLVKRKQAPPSGSGTSAVVVEDEELTCQPLDDTICCG